MVVHGGLNEKIGSSKNYDHVTMGLGTQPNYQSYTQISFILADHFNTKIIEVHMAKHT